MCSGGVMCCDLQVLLCLLGSSNALKISHRHQVNQEIVLAHPRNVNSKHCWHRNYDDMRASVDMLFNNDDVLG